MNYIDKYRKYKKKYILLKKNQKGGDQKEWFPYIKSQLATEQRRFILGTDNYPWGILAGIVSASAFTNKVSDNGYIKDDTDEELMRVWCRTVSFDYIAKLFRKNWQPDPILKVGLASDPGAHIVIYRSMDLFDLDVPDFRCACTSTYEKIKIKYGGPFIVQPVPFSCSWTNELAIEQWQNKHCCIFKILMPNNYPFITTSYPKTTTLIKPETMAEHKLYSEDIEGVLGVLRERGIVPKNQIQQELVLPPSILHILHNPNACNPVRTPSGKIIYEITCTLEEITFNGLKLIERYPERIKRSLVETNSVAECKKLRL
jgi:hypothetical protein